MGRTGGDCCAGLGRLKIGGGYRTTTAGLHVSRGGGGGGQQLSTSGKGGWGGGGKRLNQGWSLLREGGGGGGKEADLSMHSGRERWRAQFECSAS